MKILIITLLGIFICSAYAEAQVNKQNTYNYAEARANQRIEILSRLEQREKQPKYQSNKDSLKAQIADYRLLLDIADDELADSEVSNTELIEQNDSLQSRCDSLQKILDVYYPVIYQSPDIFKRELPDINSVPESLKSIYKTITQVKNAFSQLEILLNKAKKLETEFQIKPSTIYENVEEENDACYKLIAPLFGNKAEALNCFSEEQKSYLIKNLKDKYNEFNDRYQSE